MSALLFWFFDDRRCAAVLLQQRPIALQRLLQDQYRDIHDEALPRRPEVLRRLRQQGLQAPAETPQGGQGEVLPRGVRAAGYVGGDLAQRLAQQRLQLLFCHSVRASQAAAPEPYVGALRLFVPDAGNPLVPRYAEALETQWRAAALGACGIHEVPGGHFDCLGEALAQSLSKPMPEEASR